MELVQQIAMDDEHDSYPVHTGAARRMDAEQRLAELTAELDRLRRHAGSN